MKKILLMLPLTFTLFSTQVFAAQFKAISSFKSEAVQNLASVAAPIVKNKKIFGAAGQMIKVSFSRKSTEADENTVKQLTISRKVGDAGDNDGLDCTSDSPAQMVDTLLTSSINQDNEDSPATASAKSSLWDALNKIKNDSSLKVYSAGHGDDDGSWNALEVLDTKNNEILIIKLGFLGN